MIREGDDFNPREWFRKLQEEEAKAKRASAGLTLGEPVLPKLTNLTNTSNGKNARTNSGLALLRKPPPVMRRSVREVKKESPKDRLKRRLVTVFDAFDEFHESRVRDAVYEYLGAVFEIVQHYRLRRKTKRLLRRAFTFAGLPFDMKADPFAAIIRCTCEHSVDKKMISKWSRALRYVAHCKVPPSRLKAFVKEMGGINECADRFARYLGRGKR